MYKNNIPQQPGAIVYIIDVKIKDTEAKTRQIMTDQTDPLSVKWKTLLYPLALNALIMLLVA